MHLLKSCKIVHIINMFHSRVCWSSSLYNLDNVNCGSYSIFKFCIQMHILAERPTYRGVDYFASPFIRVPYMVPTSV